MCVCYDVTALSNCIHSLISATPGVYARVYVRTYTDGLKYCVGFFELGGSLEKAFVGARLRSPASNYLRFYRGT